MVPSTSLAYAAQMLEAGVPIVNVYASDAHDDHTHSGAFGPGTSGYEAQLSAYDRAFASFFDRLKRDGIDETNTLLVFTTDESDHFVGSSPMPSDCDGVHTPCTYSNIGEITADIRRLVFDQRQNATPFIVHADSAPAVYIKGNPAQDDLLTRNLERDLLGVTVVNPLTVETITLGAAAVDQVGMRFLHMGSSDRARMPTFMFYQHEDFFGTASPVAPPHPCSMDPPCIEEDSHFAYNHGDFQEDIRTTWLGMAGPGVRSLGLTDLVWSDHVDIRPTILTLAGIMSDYVHDGRTLVEYIRPERLSAAAAANSDQLIQLGNAYKEITAPFHTLGLALLDASTRALKGKDTEYALFQQGLNTLTTARDNLAGRVRLALEDALFRNIADPANLRSLTRESQLFLIRARSQLR